AAAAAARLAGLEAEAAKAAGALDAARAAPREAEARRLALLDQVAAADARRSRAADAWSAAEAASSAADAAARAADAAAGAAREGRAAAEARLDPARERLEAALSELHKATGAEPEALARELAAEAVALPAGADALEHHLAALERDRDALGAVNLRAAEEAGEQQDRLDTLARERADLQGAIARLRDGIEALNAEGRERLIAAFETVDANFRSLFAALFDGGHAELRLVESEDALEAGLEIFATPPGKRLSAMSLMSGGEQALTACALIFAVFLANPSPVCVLDEVDAPLDDANVDRFCRLLDEMRTRTSTRFIAITHNPVTMSRMDRLLGVTMAERGVSQLVSVDLARAEALATS
ncbi:MAG: AAA family ATPase, partial [Caulobacteraceae bacterium]|nr:AAA family ATPase [Caulobacter sp.]